MINSIFATVIGSESHDDGINKGNEQSKQDDKDIQRKTNGKDEVGKPNDEKSKKGETQPTKAAPEPNNTENNEWTKVVTKRKAAPIILATKQAKLQDNKGPNNKSPTAGTTQKKTEEPVHDNTNKKGNAGRANSQRATKAPTEGATRSSPKQTLKQTKLASSQDGKGNSVATKAEAKKAGGKTNDSSNKKNNSNQNKNTPKNNRINQNNSSNDKTLNKNKGYIHQGVGKWELRTFDDTEGRKPDGRPYNLETDGTTDSWIQGYSTCCAGPYCVISQPKKLSIVNRWAGCGWCMHFNCSIPWKRTATQSKENLYTPTPTINSFCRFCVASNHMKLENAGMKDAYVSTRYEAVRRKLRTDWSTIRLGNPLEGTNLNDSLTEAAKQMTEDSSTQQAGQQAITNLQKLGTTTENAMEVDDDVATVTAANETTAKEPTALPTQEATTTKYIDVQLQIVASTSDDAMEPLTKLAEKLRKWMKGVQQICPSFKLHTVDPKHENQATLHVIDELDWKKLSDIKQYFRGAQPKPKGGRLFLRVKASFDMTLTDFLGNIEWYHQNQNERIQEASLQCFQSEILGYLLYSLRSTDADAIKQALSERIGKPISVRFMRISDGAKYEEKRDTSKDPKALHIECDKEDSEAIYAKIRKIYGTSQTQFPLGIKFRFVPYRNRLLDIQSLSKYEILRIRQDNWCRQYCAVMRDDVMGLDGKISMTNKTLRDAIMSIKAQDEDKNSLVFSIDKRWRLPGLNFTFHPDKAQAGAMLVKGLVPRLVHMFSSEQIRPFFTPEAFKAGLAMEYDPLTGKVKSAADFDLEDILAENDEMSNIQSQEGTETAGPEEEFGKRFALVKERSDDDTISTFRDGHNPRKKTTVTNKSTILPTEINAEEGSTGSNSTTSSLSLTTKATMSTRISTVESKFDGMTDQVNDVKQDLAEMSQLLTLMCKNMGIEKADRSMETTMVSPDKHSGQTNKRGITNPQARSKTDGILSQTGKNPDKG